MKKVLAILGLLFVLATGTTRAESPCVLFDRSQLAELRQRIAQPQYAKLWSRVLAQAEAYCDPASPEYLASKDLLPAPANPAELQLKNREALQVHWVGRTLTGPVTTLGIAYQLSGRREFGEAGAAFLQAVVQRYPVTDPIVAKGFAGGRGDIMRGLALGYDLLGDCLDDEARQRVASACADYIENFLREANDPKIWWSRVHNFNGVCGGAAGCLALALSDAYPDRVDAWAAECVKILERWLSDGFDEEGAYLEGVSYSAYGLSNTVLFADALERSGRGNLWNHPTFDKLPTFYALSLLPGEGVYDARNDSSYRGLGVLLLRLAEAKQNGLCRWLWDTSGEYASEGPASALFEMLWENHVPPVDPTAAGVPHAEHFRGRGLCVWRTGWNSSDVMFSIEAGPFAPVTHNQADKGHFTLYGLGHHWATDPGYANENGPKGRGQAMAHSQVLIDGAGQARSGAGCGTNGTIERYTNDSRYGYALADLTEAYQHNSKGMPGVGVAHAQRHAFFLYPREEAPAYAIVLDDIVKDDQPHEYTWQMMTDEVAVPQMSDSRAVLEPCSVSGSGSVAIAGEADPDSLSEHPGVSRWEFDVRQPGHYVLWARLLATGGARPADGLKVSLDDGAPVAARIPKGSDWAWVRVNSADEEASKGHELAAGKHHLAVELRQPKLQLDCLLLTPHKQAPPYFSNLPDDAILLEAEAGQLAEPLRIVSEPPPQARLVARLFAAAAVTLSTDRFQPVDDRGPASFPRFRASTQAVNPRFIAVLLPLPRNVAEPEVSVENREGTRVVHVRWPGHTDTVIWSDSDGSATLQDVP